MIRKTMLVLCFVLFSASAELILDYQENVFVLPYSNSRIPITVTNTGEKGQALRVDGTTDLKLNFDKVLEIGAGETKEFSFFVNSSGIGTHNLKFWIGWLQGDIEIRVSETPRAIERAFELYSSELRILGNRWGDDSEILLAKDLVEQGMTLTEQGRYVEANNVLGELDTQVRTIKSREIPIEEETENPIKLRMSILGAMALMLVAFAPFVAKRFKESEETHIDHTKELSQINKKIQKSLSIELGGRE